MEFHSWLAYIASYYFFPSELDRLFASMPMPPEVVSCLYALKIPAILVTQYLDQDYDDTIRRWRRNVPVLIDRDNINPEQTNQRSIFIQIKSSDNLSHDDLLPLMFCLIFSFRHSCPVISGSKDTFIHLLGKGFHHGIPVAQL